MNLAKIHKKEECGPVAKTTSSTGYEPNVIDNSDYSETYTAIFQNESVDIDTEPSHSFDAELDDELIKKGQSSQLFTQDQEAPANLRQTYHSHEEMSVTSSVPFHTNTVRRDPCTNHVQICVKNGNQLATWETSKSGFSLKDKKSKFLLQSDLRSRSTNLKPSLAEECIPELSGITDSQRMKIDHTITRCEQSTRDQLLQEEMSEQNRDLRETCIRNMRDIEELQKSHVLKVEDFSRRKLTEDFEEVTSFFQGSNVKTVYILGDNDAKQMLRLTTSTPGIRWLHHCTFWSEKQVRASCRFITRKRESLFQGAQSILASTGQPVDWMSQKCKSDQEFDNLSDQDPFWKDKGNKCSQKQNPRSWDMNTERILPKMIFVNWRDKLILKRWKLGILEQGMNSPEENKLYFTKNWQIENEHFVILVLEVLNSWKNWGECRNFDSKNLR